MGAPLVVRRIRRTVAALLLPCVAAAFAAPIPAHQLAAGSDCHAPAPAAIAVSHGDGGPHGCEHTAGTACAAMVGCVVLPSADVRSASHFAARNAFAVVAPPLSGALHGRLGFGPPTPPPNS